MSVAIRGVCKDCNNGWMSRLETRAKPILERLVTARSHEPCDIEAQDLEVMATWATKISMLIDHTYHQGNGFWTARERARLRRTATPPRYTHVWVARMGSDTHWALWNVAYSREAVSGFGIPTPHCVSAFVGRFAFQVVTVRNGRGFAGYYDLDPGRGWADTTRKIYPIHGRISWPHDYYLTDSGFDGFSRRWRPGWGTISKVPFPLAWVSKLSTWRKRRRSSRSRQR